MSDLDAFLRHLDDLLSLLRARISPVTVVAAVMAAGGVVVIYVGLLSVRRVSLDEESARISGVRAPSRLDQLQMRLTQSGLRIRVAEFLLIGCCLGLALGAVLAVLGFVATGVALVPAGPFLYYRYLMHKRAAAQQKFREQLPDAIHDFLQYFAIKKNIAFTIEALASKGPLAVRPEFEQANSLIKRRVPVEASLEAVGQSRSEAFFRHFMDALAQHDQQGGDLKAVLLRIARAQRSQLRLHSRIAAQQSGARMVGVIYAVAPLAFLLFVRVMGGAAFADFYATPLGQIAQMFILASGAASWWLTNTIARRGIYLSDDPATPALSSDVRQTGYAKPVLPKE
ncbi:MAG: hypothetical protein HC853_08030 [Anaerolineae bacterium]|nr:hypothetical protein [Anaerolineae bacterium]